MKAYGLAIAVIAATSIYPNSVATQTPREACLKECQSEQQRRSNDIDEERSKCTPKCSAQFIDPEPPPTLEDLNRCRDIAQNEVHKPNSYWECTGQWKTACILRCDRILDQWQQRSNNALLACETECKSKFPEPGSAEPGPPGKTPPMEPTGSDRVSQSRKYILRGGPAPWGAFGWRPSGRWAQVCVEEPWGVHCFPPTFVQY